MEWWLITFLLGAIVSLFMPIVPEFFWVIVFIIFGLICLLNKRTRIYSGFCFGVFWILFSALQFSTVWESNNTSKSQLFEKHHLVLGEVIDIPTQKNSQDLFNYKFNFHVKTIDSELLSNPLIIRLSWNKTKEKLYQGQVLALKVKLKPPHGFANTGGFSYQTWLRQKQIFATGYVVKSKNNQIINSDYTYRQKLYFLSKKVLPNNNLSPVLTALSFGEKGDVTQDIWDVLQRTNTQHLIAISGLHLGLIASASFFLCIFLLRKLPLIKIVSVKYDSHYPSFNLLATNYRLFAIVGSCLFTVYYAYLAGFSLPTLRALIMLLVFWLLRLSGVNWRVTRWLLVTMFWVVILMPFSLISASFWLSFYAVGLIFISLWRFKEELKGKTIISTWFKSLVGMQLLLSLFMLPMTMIFNYQISLASVLANVIAVPWMSFTCIPLCLLAVVFLPFSDFISTWLYQLALLSLEALWVWLSYLSHQPWALIDISFEIVSFITLIVVGLASLFFWGIHKRYVFLYFTVLIFFYTRSTFNGTNEQWSITVLDVGQGLSVLIEKNDKAILYDTGASYPSGFNMVDVVLMPYLKHKGINTLDKVIISHSDNDHAGGLPQLKEQIYIKELIGNDPVLKADKTCKQGEHFTWQGLTFLYIWPSNERSDNVIGDDNDESCVVHISDGKSSALLTGDISMKTEKIISANALLSSRLKSDILVAPHHGSNTSSSNVFIEYVNPHYVVFSTGFRNRWNMPSKLVKERYAAHDVKTFNTATEGLIEFRFNSAISINGEQLNTADKIKVYPYRERKWPFWFAN